jgi:peptide/nickel transport system permease protein
MEWLLPGNFGDDEWFSSASSIKNTDFISIFLEYLRPLFLDASLQSLSYADKSVSQVFEAALQQSLKIILPSIGFFVFLLFGSLWVASLENRQIQKVCTWITDFILSIPYLILVPFVVFVIPTVYQQGLFNWIAITVASILLSVRLGAISLQVFVNTKRRLEGEAFVRTWFAIGGGEKNVVFSWLAPLIWAPWVQSLPSTLVHWLTGNILMESLFRYPGLGSLFIESLESRDWPILRFYLVWVSILFFVIQVIADYVMSTLDPRLREESE